MRQNNRNTKCTLSAETNYIAKQKKCLVKTKIFAKSICNQAQDDRHKLFIYIFNTSSYQSASITLQNKIPYNTIRLFWKLQGKPSTLPANTDRKVPLNTLYYINSFSSYIKSKSPRTSTTQQNIFKENYRPHTQKLIRINFRNRRSLYTKLPPLKCYKKKEAKM